MRNEVTQLLIASKEGDRNAIDKLFPYVFDELRNIARRQLSRERNDHTLDSIALISEAYLKLVHQEKLTWQNRAHFFAIASRSMRTILIDYARSRNAAKRGAGVEPVSIEELSISLSEEQADHLLELDEALQRLEEVNEEAARIVEYKYFGGLTTEETASVLSLSVATARRRWDFAKAWLNKELSKEDV
ncbi:MAG: sigma-70 family RNA polymerase sigma factor [Balneolaceae bacterium]